MVELRLHLILVPNKRQALSGAMINQFGPAYMCATRAPFQYPIRRLTVRSRNVSKPRDLYLELSDRSEIWQAPRQQGCRSACQNSKRCDNLDNQCRGFETSRDLTIRRLIGYWNGALASTSYSFSKKKSKVEFLFCFEIYRYKWNLLHAPKIEWIFFH